MADQERAQGRQQDPDAAREADQATREQRADREKGDAPRTPDQGDTGRKA